MIYLFIELFKGLRPCSAGPFLYHGWLASHSGQAKGGPLEGYGGLPRFVFFRGGFEVLKNQFAVRSAGLAWLGACNTSEPATALDTTRLCVILCCFAHSRRSMLTNAFRASIVYRYSCLGPHPSSPAPPCSTPSQSPMHRSHVQVFFRISRNPQHCTWSCSLATARADPTLPKVLVDLEWSRLAESVQERLAPVRHGGGESIVGGGHSRLGAVWSTLGKDLSGVYGCSEDGTRLGNPPRETIVYTFWGHRKNLATWLAPQAFRV